MEPFLDFILKPLKTDNSKETGQVCMDHLGMLKTSKTVLTSEEKRSSFLSIEVLPKVHQKIFWCETLFSFYYVMCFEA